MALFEHDFKNFPELSNSQLQELEFVSPFPQIKEDFTAEVVKVHDGDTCTLRVGFRDFDFPLRFGGIDAPELNAGGEEARKYVKDWIEGKSVYVILDEKRVGKYGRLLGTILYMGLNVSDTLLRLGYAVPFGKKMEGKIPSLNKDLNLDKWL